MGAPTNYYVDPGGGDDGTGDGLSDATAWATVQNALNSITRDSTNGDQINVKAGTDDVLSGSALSLASYGGGTATAPLIIRGYTSTADDGGIGGISGGGSVAVFGAGSGNIHFIDMHLHNTGTAAVLTLGNNGRAINCEVDNTTGAGISAGTFSLVAGCHIHNCGGNGVTMHSGVVFACYLANGTNDFTNAINFSSSSNDHQEVNWCVISVDGTTNGIVFGDFAPTANHNSLLTSGSGTGITQSSNSQTFTVANNLLEGWGTGVDLSASTSNTTCMATGNAEFNCTTGFSLGDQQYVYSEDNESLGATPFAKSGSDTYANRATYFEPQDTGNVLSPYGGMAAAKGAIQPAGGGGGSGTGGVVIARRVVRHFHL